MHIAPWIPPDHFGGLLLPLATVRSMIYCLTNASLTTHCSLSEHSVTGSHQLPTKDPCYGSLLWIPARVPSPPCTPTTLQRCHTLSSIVRMITPISSLAPPLAALPTSG